MPPLPPQGKLQKHQAFEAEVQANAGAIIKLDETGNLMISEGHFASETIRVRDKDTHPHSPLSYVPDQDRSTQSTLFNPDHVWFSPSRPTGLSRDP